MKKIIFLLVLLMLPVMVYAEDVLKLVPVDTKASFKTENFDYNNFVYSSSVDEKGNGLITFESIKNNGVTKKPISVNILLFGCHYYRYEIVWFQGCTTNQYPINMRNRHQFCGIVALDRCAI